MREFGMRYCEPGAGADQTRSTRVRTYRRRDSSGWTRTATCMRRITDSVRPSGESARYDAATPGILPSWLLMTKVMAPSPPAGYVHRPALLERIDMVLDRRITVLQAPAGFGKTAVLADVTRRKRKEGVIVAWLSLDQDDTPDVLGDYLA